MPGALFGAGREKLKSSESHTPNTLWQTRGAVVNAAERLKNERRETRIDLYVT